MEKLPCKTMFDGDLINYAKKLKIPYFIGVMMRDELPPHPKLNECGILNLNTHLQQGSHWICWYKKGKMRYYFDSFAEPPPSELLTYLKTSMELTEDTPCIIRNAVTVQHDESSECGSLCLFVLKRLSSGITFPDILTFLESRYNKRSSEPLKIEL